MFDRHDPARVCDRLVRREYGTIGGAGSPYEPRWPYRNLGNSDIFASFAMQCGLNEYAPEGRPMHEVS